MKHHISILLLSVLLFGCGLQPQQTPLLGNLPSQISPDETRNLIKIDQKDWVTVEENSSAGNKNRPPFTFLAVVVKEHSDLNVPGEARFYFLNNRLMSVAFYPHDMETYKKKLENQKHITLEVRKNNYFKRILLTLLGKKSESLEDASVMEAHIPPQTRVELLRDYRGKQNFYFQDEYLAQEHDKWIRDHT